MPLYIVERHLPGLTTSQLKAAASQAKKVTTEMAEEGVPVRYRRSTYVPTEQKCVCLFDGPSADVVRQANERANLPFERILEAEHVDSDEL